MLMVLVAAGAKELARPREWAFRNFDGEWRDQGASLVVPLVVLVLLELVRDCSRFKAPLLLLRLRLLWPASSCTCTAKVRCWAFFTDKTQQGNTGPGRCTPATPLLVFTRQY